MRLRLPSFWEEQLAMSEAEQAALFSMLLRLRDGTGCSGKPSA